MGLKEERGRKRELQTGGQTGGGTDRQGDRETDSLSFESNETHRALCGKRTVHCPLECKAGNKQGLLMTLLKGSGKTVSVSNMMFSDKNDVMLP